MLFLRQSTASQEVLLGPFVSDTDGKTAQTGLTIANTDIKLWVEGATTEANKTSGGATHIASGRYYAVLDATDTATVGKLEINVHVSGALPVRREFHVLEEAVYDSLFAAAAAGYQVPIWAAANSTVNLSGTTIATTQKVDVDTIKTNPVVNAGTVTFPTGATLASTTNITAGTITTVTNLTNAPPDSSGVTTLLSRIPSGIFTGITSLAQWLGLIAGKQTGNSTARTELRATGAGSGTFDETTDSVEALRDRGDAAWTTASGFATAAELAKVPKSDSNVTWNATALASINAEADTALSDYGALKPTTAGRTLDVTATGAAGIDWGNVENPTTVLGLSGTTIKTATDVETDTADIQSRIPAALSAGRMKADIEAINGNTGGVSNLNDFAVSCYDAGLHQVLLVATTTTAGALGTTAKSDVNAEVAAALTTYDAVTQADLDARTLLAAEYALETTLEHVNDVVDGIDITADAIKLKTDNLPADPADASDIAGSFTTVNGKLDTIDDFLDTEVAAIKAKTDQLTFTVANQVDSNALSGGGSGLDAAGVRAAVGLAAANLDTQLADIPTFAEFEARTIASASYATATALGTTDTRVQTLTTRVGIPAVSVSDDIAAVKTDTGNLVTRITSTLFSGITSMGQWLGALAGKQVADSTARTEIRATGAGSGTFDETTDSLQAVRDRGDAAWGGEATVGQEAIDAIVAGVAAITGSDPAAVPAANATFIAKIDYIVAELAGRRLAERDTGDPTTGTEELYNFANQLLRTKTLTKDDSPLTFETSKATT